MTERRFPVPRFTKERICAAHLHLSKVFSEEMANLLCNRLPVLKEARADPIEQQRDDYAWLALAKTKCPLIDNYYLTWVRLANALPKDDIATNTLILYALLIDGFANELNQAKLDCYLGRTYVSRKQSYETPLTEASYGWPAAAQMLLDLPLEYGLDVNVCIGANDGKLHPLYWVIVSSRADYSDTKVWESLLSRSSDAVLNARYGVSVGLTLLQLLILKLEFAPLFLSELRMKLLTSFLSYARNDGTGVSVDTDIKGESTEVNCFEYVRDQISDKDMKTVIITELQSTIKRIETYQQALPIVIRSIIHVPELAAIVTEYSMRRYRLIEDIY